VRENLTGESERPAVPDQRWMVGVAAFGDAGQILDSRPPRGDESRRGLDWATLGLYDPRSARLTFKGGLRRTRRF
jgi:hypothetical protein